MQRIWNDLDRFDRAVFISIAVLILAIVGISLLGDNIGVQIESVFPATTGKTDTDIRVRFFSDMDTASVEKRFSVNPETDGTFRWNGERELVFEPSQALTSGEIYTITIQAGAKAKQTNTVLKDDMNYQFRVNFPKVVYLAPASAQQRNLYLYDLNVGEQIQLTDTEWGIADYAVSPDGQYVAYTLYNEDGTSDLWLYDVETHSTSQLTNCVSASCGAPAWKGDGTQIAYEREDYDAAFGTLGARRIWIVDLRTAQSTLLFDDTQVTAHSPQFSPNGNRIAVFGTNPPGILIHDFINGSEVFIDSLQGLVGNFSADSTKLVYPVMVRGAIGSTFYSQLESVDLVENRRDLITGTTDTPIEDSSGVWRPGSPNELAVTRRYLDERYTDGPQVYLLNIDTNEAQPLVVDNAYTQGALEWSPDGNLLVIQRFNRVEQGARPEIWLYDLNANKLELVAEDAYLPGFVP